MRPRFPDVLDALDAAGFSKTDLVLAGLTIASTTSAPPRAARVGGLAVAQRANPGAIGRSSPVAPFTRFVIATA